MTPKTMLTLSAFAVAGVAAVHLSRLMNRLRKTHLQFDFPIEEQLFIGWGGSEPKRVRRAY